jgi:pimeloyl-ACP methyl ester carboxylesterase
VAGSYPTTDLLAEVDAAFRSLPERYLGAAPGFDATYHLRLADVGHTWEVRCTAHGARVRHGATSRRADVTIWTDAATWLRLRQGELSGIEAFGQRLLTARGELDLAVGFEGLFRLPNGRPPLLRIEDVPVGRERISTLTMGAGPDVLLIHGLGSTKASFFDTAAALSRCYRVHAIDLPGFGSSSKPLAGAYNARWFASHVHDLLDQLGIERARLVGNSMGGRVAVEVGLQWPERVSSLALLCPAVAFVRRDFHPLVRILRPEFGVLPHRFSRAMVEGQFWSLFADRDRVDPAVGEVVVDEFQRIYASHRARLAFLSAARNIYLDRPFGRGGFYDRLAGLAPPALFIWGTDDRLIPSGFSRHVRRALPQAEQIVLRGCGHVPQVERPEQTDGIIERFFARCDGVSVPRALRSVA